MWGQSTRRLCTPRSAVNAYYSLIREGSTDATNVVGSEIVSWQLSQILVSALEYVGPACFSCEVTGYDCKDLQKKTLKTQLQFPSDHLSSLRILATYFRELIYPRRHVRSHSFFNLQPKVEAAHRRRVIIKKTSPFFLAPISLPTALEPHDLAAK